jgi:hypothetical protein
MLMLYIFFNRSIVVKLSQLKKAIVFLRIGGPQRTPPSRVEE